MLCKGAPITRSNKLSYSPRNSRNPLSPCDLQPFCRVLRNAISGLEEAGATIRRNDFVMRAHARASASPETKSVAGEYSRLTVKRGCGRFDVRAWSWSGWRVEVVVISRSCALRADPNLTVEPKTNKPNVSLHSLIDSWNLSSIDRYLIEDFLRSIRGLKLLTLMRWNCKARI